MISCMLVMFMAGCAEIAVPVVNDGDDGRYDWVYDAELPVPVTFSSDLGMTKVPINAAEDMDGKIFGIFAVNKADTARLSFDYGLPIRNRLARYVPGEGFRFGYASEERTIFYPVGSSENFSFYAYHAYRDDENVSPMTENADRIAVVVDVARPNDILHGVAETSGDGFNASYIRESPFTNMPKFMFSHPAAGVSFRVRMSEELSVLPDNVEFVLSQMKLSDIPVQAELCVVHKTSPDSTGVLGKVIKRQDFLWTKNGTGNLGISLFDGAETAGGGDGQYIAGPVSLGDEHFIKPQSDALRIELKFVKNIYYKRADGTYGVSGRKEYVVQSALDPSDFRNDLVGYKAGLMYRYMLEISYSAVEDAVFVTAYPDLLGS